MFIKHSDSFILQKVSDKYVLVPFGDKAINFNGLVSLNETAKFLWEKSADNFEKESLVEALLSEYNVNESDAYESVEIFINSLKEVGAIE